MTSLALEDDEPLAAPAELQLVVMPFAEALRSVPRVSKRLQLWNSPSVILGLLIMMLR